MTRLATPVLIGASLLAYAVGMVIALASVSPGEGGCVTTIWTPVGVALVTTALFATGWTAAKRGTGRLLFGLTLLAFLLVFATLAITAVSAVLCSVGGLAPGD